MDLRVTLFFLLLHSTSVVLSESDNDEAEFHNPDENAEAPELHFFEGDIETDPQLLMRGATTRTWPKGIVPYKLDFKIADNKQAVKGIKAAMKEWETKTCIRFVERTDQYSYILFTTGKGCSSQIGRRGGKQTLHLGKGCYSKGTVAHEIAHALGFFHEQSRPDRDEYVTVMWDNIKDGLENNFRKQNKAKTFGTPYDYDSLMHYGKFLFSKNKKPTLVAKQPGVKFGQRKGVSKLDAEEMNLLYKCSEKKGEALITGGPVGNAKPLPVFPVRPPPPKPLPTCIDLKKNCKKTLIKKPKMCKKKKFKRMCAKTCKQCTSGLIQPRF